MDVGFKIIFIILAIWLILYIVLEFNIINKKRKIVSKLYSELDSLFFKRLNLLAKILDIIKAYDKNQFDSFGSDLYDYIKNYYEYSYNERLDINDNLDVEIKKILLVTDVYPEMKDITKYVKFEKQLVRLNKIIKKSILKYNNAVIIYINRKKIFPSNLIATLCRFYNYKVFNINK